MAILIMQDISDDFRPWKMTDDSYLAPKDFKAYIFIMIDIVIKNVPIIVGIIKCRLRGARNWKISVLLGIRKCRISLYKIVS